MKSLIEYISEKLLINKNIKVEFDIPTPSSTSEKDIKAAWDGIFDDIRTLRTGNINLGKISLKSSMNTSYSDSKFVLYPNYAGKITIRRDAGGGTALWVQEDTLDDVVKKISKLLKRNGYNIE